MKRIGLIQCALAGFLAAAALYVVPTSSASRVVRAGDPLPAVDDVRVTILGDMTVSRWTAGEWGFSALVEVKINGAWQKILFDTGAEPANVAFNLQRMASAEHVVDAAGNPISVCDANTVVLSHNHQDHTMGLVQLRRGCLATNPKALGTAYVGGREIFWSRPYKGTSPTGRVDDNVMIAGNGIAKAFGFDPEYDATGVKGLYEATGGTFVVPPNDPANPQPLAIPDFPGVWITGHIPRVFDEKTYPGSPHVVNPSTGQDSADTVPEDQALVINTSKGLVVITGCAHSGVVNTALYAQKMLGQPVPIYALLGGYHLFQMRAGDVNTPGTLAWTAKQFLSNGLGIQYLLGAHCTGLEAFAFLRNAIGMDSLHAVYSTISTTFTLAKGITPPAPGLNRAPNP